MREALRLVLAALAAVAGTVMVASGWSESGLAGHGPGRFVLLALPWLAAAVLQSSTAAILLVGSCAAAGCLTFGEVFWGVVGCNLGAVASSTATGLGHVRQDAVFRRVLAGTVSDVALAFPVGLVFLVTDVSGGWGARLVAAADGLCSGRARSNIALADAYVEFLELGLALPRSAVVAVMMLVGSAVLVIALRAIQLALLRMGGSRRERELNRMLDRTTGFTTGLMLGATMQSSARTLSVLTPLTASGVLDLQKSLSISRAASVGTVVLPAFVMILIGVPGVAVAHLAFGLAALALCMIPVLREAATNTARRTARLTGAYPRTGLAMLLGLAIGIPLIILGVA